MMPLLPLSSARTLRDTMLRFDRQLLLAGESGRRANATAGHPKSRALAIDAAGQPATGRYADDFCIS